MSLNDIKTAIGGHAHPNTIYHALYARFFLHLSFAFIAKIFGKSRQCISDWVKKYKASGSVGRSTANKRNRKFNEQQRLWIYDYFMKHPASYLHEAKKAFVDYWKMSNQCIHDVVNPPERVQNDVEKTGTPRKTCSLSPSHNRRWQGLTIHALYNLNRSVIPISSGSRASLRPSIGARQTLCFSMRFHLTTVACFGVRDTGKRASRSFSRGSTTECHASRCLSSLVCLASKARTSPKEHSHGKSFSIRVRILPS